MPLRSPRRHFACASQAMGAAQLKSLRYAGELMVRAAARAVRHGEPSAAAVSA